MDIRKFRHRSSEKSSKICYACCLSTTGGAGPQASAGLTYAWLVNTHQPLEGINLLILVVAIVIDLGGLGGGEHHRRRR